ncbi:MAG: XRE family transcriptional regulator [Bacteroidaceae bacterium]|nr:XRE family transcriptional regulator [Bacteroidaceae bacterium]
MDELHQQSQNRPHIGSLIKKELERQERTVSWFARKLCCDRSNVYKLFKRSTIDTELLLRISQTLNYDFFEHYKKIL